MTEISGHGTPTPIKEGGTEATEKEQSPEENLLKEINQLGVLIKNKEETTWDILDRIGATIFSYLPSSFLGYNLTYRTTRDKEKIAQLKKIGNLYTSVITNKELIKNAYGSVKGSAVNILLNSSTNANRVYQGVIDEEVKNNPTLGRVKDLIESERTAAQFGKKPKESNKLSLEEFFKIKAILAKDEFKNPQNGINEKAFRKELAENNVAALPWKKALANAESDLKKVQDELTNANSHNDNLFTQDGYPTGEPPKITHKLEERIKSLKQEIQEWETGEKKLFS